MNTLHDYMESFRLPIRIPIKIKVYCFLNCKLYQILDIV